MTGQKGEITKKQNKKIPSVTGLVTTASLNVKVTEIENKISDTTDFITTPEFNRLTKINYMPQ